MTKPVHRPAIHALDSSLFALSLMLERTVAVKVLAFAAREPATPETPIPQSVQLGDGRTANVITVDINPVVPSSESR